jgi:hypothetical protein
MVKKRKWADVKDAVLKIKKEAPSEEDEAVKSSTKRKPKKAAPRGRAIREEGVDRVPAAVRNARPALGRQSQAKAWTYSD